MFKSTLESLDSCHGPYSQLNSFRNSNVFSCFLKFWTLSAALILSGSSFQRRGAWAQNDLSPNLFRLVSVICNKFLVFDLRVLVLACLTNSSLKYRGAHPYMHLKVKRRIFYSGFTPGLIHKRKEV